MWYKRVILQVLPLTRGAAGSTSRYIVKALL